ncbi:DUF2786 domain-containing protein [Nodularia spumigena]|jgi:hypothetical protein|uniref:DUF2786 domain-containing protein n=1 Tax=Nodularia spumigena UHCC 0060 TaxID=3110300 RepID=A0ABU5UUB5_NODSP|nr:DUF2786 domain-containing protein [Nodularia spumigena]MEA5527301.1 DUF2786 domain-containing protein [Nodularia spumigena UHCC 0143]MEA5609537.1 DUF2786 domain-containing protein [Nodularia spumigena UHCC 0060]MEA5613403.1 DUF2786 domain-containing protein [Nodularia spumigena UHCC 0040]
MQNKATYYAQDIEKVADKIKKLLSLSQSPNESEAFAAFSKAQEMLTRHNLSMADLVDTTPEQIEEQVINESQRQSSWKGILLNAVCQSNYCFAYRLKQSAQIKQIIFGRSVNIQSARMQFDYLVQTVDRLAKQVDGDRTFKNAFKLGAAHRLHARILEGIEKQKREGVAATGNSQAISAIVMRSLYEKLEAELKAYSEKLNLKSRNQRSSCSSEDGFVAGQLAGDQVLLNQQTGEKGQRYLPI